MDDWRQLTQAVLDYQGALASTMSSLAAPPIRPVQFVLDRKYAEASVQSARAAFETVVGLFGDAARIDEPAARLRVLPLLKEVGVLSQVSWGETAGERVKQPGRSNGQELAVRAERLNTVAVDALIRFYLDGHHPPGDEPFAETRRAWEAYESLTRFSRKRRRIAASQRHRAAWERWGASQDL